ncbi:hypothetical protein PCE1_003116 [Barthelona sp. PCE]
MFLPNIKVLQMIVLLSIVSIGVCEISWSSHPDYQKGVPDSQSTSLVMLPVDMRTASIFPYFPYSIYYDTGEEVFDKELDCFQPEVVGYDGGNILVHRCYVPRRESPEVTELQMQFKNSEGQIYFSGFLIYNTPLPVMTRFKDIHYNVSNFLPFFIRDSNEYLDTPKMLFTFADDMISSCNLTSITPSGWWACNVSRDLQQQFSPDPMLEYQGMSWYDTFILDMTYCPDLEGEDFDGSTDIVLTIESVLPDQIFQEQSTYPDIIELKLSSDDSFSFNDLDYYDDTLKICMGNVEAEVYMCVSHESTISDRYSLDISEYTKGFFNYEQIFDDAITNLSIRVVFNEDWPHDVAPDGFFVSYAETNIYECIVLHTFLNATDTVSLPKVTSISPNLVEYIGSNPGYGVDIALTIGDYSEVYPSYNDPTSQVSQTITRMVLGKDNPLDNVNVPTECSGQTTCLLNIRLEKDALLERFSTTTFATYDFGLPVGWWTGNVPDEYINENSTLTFFVVPSPVSLSTTSLPVGVNTSLEIKYQSSQVPDLSRWTDLTPKFVLYKGGSVTYEEDLDLDYSTLGDDLQFTVQTSSNIVLGTIDTYEIEVYWTGTRSDNTDIPVAISSYITQRVESINFDELSVALSGKELTITMDSPANTINGVNSVIRFINVDDTASYIDVNTKSVDGATIVVATPFFSAGKTVSLLYSPNGIDFLEISSSDPTLTYVEGSEIEISKLSEYLLTPFCDLTEPEVNLTIFHEAPIPTATNETVFSIILTDQLDDVVHTQTIASDDVSEDLKTFIVRFNTASMCSKLSLGSYTIEMSAEISPIYSFEPVTIYVTYPPTFTSLEFAEHYQYGQVVNYLIGEGFTAFVGSAASTKPKLRFNGTYEDLIGESDAIITFMNATHANFTVPSFRYSIEADVFVSLFADDFELTNMTFEFNKCELGQQATTFEDVCTNCSIGTYADERGAIQCADAPEGTYVNTTAAATYHTCPDHSSSAQHSTSVMDCYCNSGYYGAVGGPCYSCPSHATCDAPNNRWPIPEEGAYRDEVDFALISLCQPEEACLGFVAANCSSDACTTQCASGYIGDRCASCDEGYYKTDESCAECPSSSGQTGIMTFLSLTGMYILIVLQSASDEISDDIGDFWELVSSDSFSKGMKRIGRLVKFSKLAVFINFSQILGLFQTFNLDLGALQSFFSSIFNFFKETFSFDFLNFTVNPQCVTPLTFYDYYIVKLLLLPICFAVLFFIGCLIWLLPRILGCCKCMKDRKKPFVNVFDKVVSAFVLIAIYTYTFISDSIISIRNCYSPSGGDLQVLFRAPDVVCYDDKWNSFQPYFYLGVAVYVIGVPFTLAFILNRLNKKKALNKPKAKALLGCLYSNYKPESYMFEIAVMCKKLVIIMTTVLFADQTEGSMVALLFLFAFLLAHTRLLPYDDYRDNLLEFVSLLTLFVTLLAMILMNSNISDRSKTWIGVIDFILVLSNVILFLWMFYGQIKDLCRNDDELTKENSEKRLLDTSPSLLNIGDSKIELSNEESVKFKELLEQWRKEGKEKDSPSESETEEQLGRVCESEELSDEELESIANATDVSMVDVLALDMEEMEELSEVPEFTDMERDYSPLAPLDDMPRVKSMEKTLSAIHLDDEVNDVKSIMMGTIAGGPQHDTDAEESVPFY